MFKWIILVYNIENMDVPIITQLHRYPTEIERERDKKKIEDVLPKKDYIAVCQIVEGKK